MKLTPDEERVIRRMAPGALCRDGFLGTDRRPLRDVLASDNADVERLGLTHEQIAAALEELLQAAADRLGAPVQIGENLTATYHEAMGRIPSPWSGCGVFRKGEVELVDSRTGRTYLFTPLSVHLIGKHGFYEGRGSRYRLEPADLAELLNLKKPARK